MKVLILTREYPPEIYGGAGVHVDYLTRELARLMPVEVRTFGEQASALGNLAVRGHRFALGDAGDTPEKFLFALQALRVCLSFASRPIEADVVHCHTWYAHFGGLLVKILYGLPLVVTAHSLEPLRPWKREQLGRGADLAAWVEKIALEAADKVVAVSHEMRRDILDHFAVSPDRVTVIGNGIDTEEYRPDSERDRLARFGLAPGRPYILFLGRLSRQKGICHLLAAVPRLPREVQVVLCAGAPDTPAIGTEVAAAVARLQATRGGIVWIRELVDKPTAIQLYSHAAVFCCPSIYEPFGIINLEAMACRTPVVASAVGGIPEVVTHGETGLLVPVLQAPRSPFEPVDPARFAADLADAVNTLLADESLRRRMGEAGRRRAETRFSWRAVAMQTRALYEALLGRRASRSAAGEERGRS